jgi:hypothetical protein
MFEIVQRRKQEVTKLTLLNALISALGFGLLSGVILMERVDRHTWDWLSLALAFVFGVSLPELIPSIFKKVAGSHTEEPDGP